MLAQVIGDVCDPYLVVTPSLSVPRWCKHRRVRELHASPGILELRPRVMGNAEKSKRRRHRLAFFRPAHRHCIQFIVGPVAAHRIRMQQVSQHVGLIRILIPQALERLCGLFVAQSAQEV